MIQNKSTELLYRACLLTFGVAAFALHTGNNQYSFNLETITDISLGQQASNSVI
ncbi:hypothetical protein BJX68DRAFT_225533 [Aspergillus pseudodeflectus]|uniref:Uncharacterized protein n=1 Tax=Aspergillus pseudodeflectus TaxID=176178 RepID=A0ABR4L8Q1_9EURO